jgi:hypothetical protein
MTEVGVMKISLQFMKFVLRVVKVSIWCAVRACKIVGPEFFKGRNSSNYVKFILPLLFWGLTEEQKI